MVVVLNHELFRFLYPYEPVCDFVHTDPVPFSIKHIENLIKMGENISATVSPYADTIQRFNAGTFQAESLEKSTSNLYSELWKEFDDDTLFTESLTLLKNRLPESFILEEIVGKTVLDLGCGSGRYTIALSLVGAAKVVGVDFQSKSFAASKKWAVEKNLAVEFKEGNVHDLPFADEEFDFVFCNGVLHHSSSIQKGLDELIRVLKKPGKSFLYLYAANAFFWDTRIVMRRIFNDIPLDYTKAVLNMIGMPSNRFIFCDTWYVPTETLTTTKQLETMLNKYDLSYSKLVGQAKFDLDKAIDDGILNAVEMWGDGELRYILSK